MISHYNKVTGEWEVLASSEASDISTNSPRFIKESGEVVSVNEALEKVDKKITKLTKNMAWIYQNGAIGGGGDGSVESAIFDLLHPGIITEGSKKFLYMSGSDIKIPYQVKYHRNNLKYNISIVLDGSIKIETNKLVDSNTIGNIELTGLDPNKPHYLQFTGFDNEGFAIESLFLNIDSGSISLTSDKIKTTDSIYLGDDYKMTFNIINNVIGQLSTLKVVCNSVEEDAFIAFSEQGKWSTVVDLRTLLVGKNPLKVGTTYSIVAEASTYAGGILIKTKSIVLTVSVNDSESLILTTGGMTEGDTPDDDPKLTEILLGNPITFSYVASSKNFEIFYTAFKITNAGSAPVMIGDFNNYAAISNTTVYKGKITYFNYRSLDLVPGVTTIEMKAWSSNGVQSATKTLKCTMKSTGFDSYSDSNPNKLMYANYNAFLDKGTSRQTQWKSVINDYEGRGETIETITDIYNTNGITSGFIETEMFALNVPCLRLSGGAHAVVNLQPFKEITGGDLSNWFNGSGFGLSFTFKSDTHPSAIGTIMSLANYNRDKELTSGFTITLEEVKAQVLINKKLESISCKIALNKTTTVDITLNIIGTNNEGILKILVNGVLSAAMDIPNVNLVEFETESKIILGCRDVTLDPMSLIRDLDQSCDVNLYSMRFYKTGLSDYDIIRNFINADGYTHLNDARGVDLARNKMLRAKNFFSNDGSCGVWNSRDNNYEQIGLYDWMFSQSDLPIPVLVINETDDSTNFKEFYENTYTTKQAPAVLGEKFNCSMTIKNTDNKTEVIPSGMKVSLQGTSSLAYSAKNLEIYFGNEPGTTTRRLFQPKEDWLPENQFTLKADVVDSAHANNSAIGEFINKSGIMDNLPPMNDTRNNFSHMVKHTLEGFPVFLFVKFGGMSTPKFLGIYNFNLGRGSYYNMGFKVLESFTTAIGNTGVERVPGLVTSYKELLNHTHKDNVFSYEFTENQNLYGSFQQDSDTIINHITSLKFPEDNANLDNGRLSFKKVFTEFAHFFTEGDSAPKMEYVDQTYTPIGEGDVYPYERMTLARFEDRVNWKNANAYFLIASLFGMVDSLGKNMTMRTWDLEGQWYTCFYDMDTALGLNNNGLEAVGKTSYIHTYKNTDDLSKTSSILINENDPNGHYDTYNSRLWNTMLKLLINDAGEVKNDPHNYRNMWREWRGNNGVFKNINTFVDNYYSIHTSNVGEILFNYDYQIKYLDKYELKVENPSGGIDLVMGYNSIRFLHGNRVSYVKDWLRKRMWFLDGVFGLGDSETGESVDGVTYEDAPYTSKIFNRARGNSNDNKGSMFKLAIETDAPQFFKFTSNTSENQALLQENETTDVRILAFSGSNTPTAMNIANRITKIDGYKDFNWEVLKELRLPSLMDLNLEGMHSLLDNKSIDFTGLQELRNLNLRKLTTESTDSAGLTLDLNRCYKLKTVDISESEFTSIVLPGSSGLEEALEGGSISDLKVAGSKIRSMYLKNQSFITELDFTNCSYLETVDITSCPGIKKIILNDSGVQKITISDCSSLEIIECKSGLSLTSIIIDKCESLTDVNLYMCTHPALKINLVGATNMVNCNLGYVKTSSPILLDKGFVESDSSKGIFKTLKVLDIRHSKISTIQYSGRPVENVEGSPVIDLSPLEGLTNIISMNNESVEYFRFRNVLGNPFNVLSSETFSRCPSLKRVFGHINLGPSGSAYFNECNSFSIWGTGNGGNYVSEKFHDFSGASNISLSTSNLNSAFYNTSVTLYDLAYIMGKIDMSKVTTASSMFYSCDNIKTSAEYALNRNTFINCANLSNANLFFYGCSNMKGPLYSSEKNADGTWKYNGLMSPLKSLTSAQYMFKGAFELVDSYFFYKCSDTLFLKLTNLQYIFANTVQSVVDTNKSYPVSGSIDSAEWLTYMPNLTSLSYAFSGNSNLTINFRVENIEKPDGVIVPTTLFFHNNLNVSNMMNAFSGCKGVGTITGNIFGGAYPVVSYNGVTYNSRFPKYLNNIENVFSGMTGVTCDMTDFDSLFTSNKNIVDIRNCFNGTKKIGTKYPMDVFKGLNKLTHVDGFFRDATFTLSTAPDLPGTMFLDCKSLQSINSLYYGMKSKGTITGNGFINCVLQDVSNSFRAMTEVTGSIPYKLFHLEYEVKIEHEGLLFTKKVLRKTITNFANAFYQSRSLNNPYFLDKGDSTVANPGDMIAPNYSYDPRPTLPQPTVEDPLAVVTNLAYSPESHVWDMWSIDGTNIDFGSSVHPLVTKYGPIPNVYYRDDKSYSDHATLSGFANYFCPMDFFRCASNIPSVNVTGVFAYMCTDGAGGSIDADSGIEGRIPPRLLEPVSNTTSIANMFSSDKKLKPYSLDQSYTNDGGILTQVKGDMIYKDFFKGMSNLSNMSGAFSNFVVLANTRLNDDLFKPLIQLNVASKLFEAAQFLGVNQVSGSFLNNNRNLRDVSYMFASSSSDSTPWIGRGLALLPSGLLNRNIHKNITILTGFMKYCNKTTGTSINFDEFTQVFTNVSACYKLCTALSDFSTIPSKYTT